MRTVQRSAATSGSSGSPAAAVAGPPRLDYDAFPREVGKRDIEVTEAAARIANALNLYLD